MGRLWCYQVRDPEISEIEEPDATIIADSKRKRSSDSCGQHEACVCSSRIFHHECIGSWLQTHKSCPNCREPIEPPSAEPMKPILQLCRRPSGLQIPEDFDVMDLLSEENPATCTNLLGTWEKEATTTTIGTESPGSSCLTNSSSSMQSGIV